MRQAKPKALLRGVFQNFRGEQELAEKAASSPPQGIFAVVQLQLVARMAMSL
jgi:hypothetical protein